MPVAEPKRIIAPNTREIRAFGAELRAGKDDAGKRTISGYAALFNTWSHDLGGFIECIMPGAFTRTLADPANDIVCTFDHGKGNAIMGRRSNNTLTLTQDTKGLAYTCSLPDTSAAEDLVALIERRDIQGCSFEFRVPSGGSRWEWTAMPGQPDKRFLLDVDLWQVGPVIDPAYPSTTVDVRSYTDAREAHLAAIAEASRTRAARLRLAAAD